MSALAVTGIGLVSAPADEPRALLDRLASPQVPGDGAARPIADFDPARYVRRKGLRHLSRVSQLACAAAARVADGLREVPPASVGVVLGSTWASLESIVRFESEAHREGPRHVDPGLFAETVANVPAGHVSIFFGWSALNATVAAGPLSGVQALVTAAELLADGRAEAIVAGGADELNGHALRTLGGAVVGGEGACLLVLESERHAAARGARRLGRLLGGVVAPVDPAAPGGDSARARILREALAAAGVGAGEIGLVVVSEPAGRDQQSALDQVFAAAAPPRRLAPKRLLGETWSAAAPLGVALALAGQALPALVLEESGTGQVGALVVGAGE